MTKQETFQHRTLFIDDIILFHWKDKTLIEINMKNCNLIKILNLIVYCLEWRNHFPVLLSINSESQQLMAAPIYWKYKCFWSVCNAIFKIWKLKLSCSFDDFLQTLTQITSINVSQTVQDLNFINTNIAWILLSEFRFG